MYYKHISVNTQRNYVLIIVQLIKVEKRERKGENSSMNLPNYYTWKDSSVGKCSVTVARTGTTIPTGSSYLASLTKLK